MTHYAASKYLPALAVLAPGWHKDTVLSLLDLITDYACPAWADVVDEARHLRDGGETYKLALAVQAAAE